MLIQNKSDYNQSYFADVDAELTMNEAFIMHNEMVDKQVEDSFSINNNSEMTETPHKYML